MLADNMAPATRHGVSGLSNRLRDHRETGQTQPRDRSRKAGNLFYTRADACGAVSHRDHVAPVWSK